jgi:iron complex outermembrane receptor protein
MSFPPPNYKDSYAVGLKDMLARTPGVLAQPRWGEESRLSIRGSGISRGFHMRGIAILQDGIPFSFADGSTDFQELDPLALQHLEVYRGGQALRYGTATLGGAVNAVTPSARNLDYHGQLRLEGGSYATKRSHADGGYIINNVDLYGSLTHAESDGFREQSEQDNTKFNANMGIRITPDIETRTYLSWNDLNQEVPGTVSKASALNTPTRVPFINADDDYARDIQSMRISNRTVFNLGGGAQVEAGGYINDKQLYHPIFDIIDQDSLDTGVFTRIKNERSVLGLNLGRGVNYADRYVNEGGNRGAQSASGRQIARNAEIYGEHRFALTDALDAITGFQAQVSERDYTDNVNSARSDEKIYRSFNPKFGLMWKLDANNEVYTSLTRSSELPTFSELVQGAIPGFVPVNMQTAWTAELGTRGARGAWDWDATIYRAHIKDEMLQYAVTPNIPASTFNAGETVHQGIELGLGYRFSDAWSMQGVYNYSDFFFDGDVQFGDNKIAGAAPHEIRIFLQYKNGPFTITPNVEWVPQAAWVDFANTAKSDSYALLNLKAEVEINERTTFFIDGRNLTNEKYIPSFSTVTDARTANMNVFYPGDGASAYAGLKVKF